MVLCIVWGCGSKSGKHKGLGFFRIPKIITDQGEEYEELTRKRRERWIGCRSFRQRVVSPTVVSQTSPVSSQISLVSSQTCRSQFANVINIHMCRSQFSSDFGCQHLTIQTNSQA